MRSMTNYCHSITKLSIETARKGFFDEIAIA
jgi:hypothetical protein